MAGFLWNALNDADAHRANAVDRANKGRRGGSTVRVFNSARTMDETRGGVSEGGKIAFAVRERWRIMKDDAIWQFQVAVHGDPTEGFIPW